MENNNDFLFNNLFSFENHPSIIKMDIKHTSPNSQPETTFKICTDSSRVLTYSYSPKSGLNLTGTSGGLKERNILGKLISIPSNNVQLLKDFFEMYGFLYPVSDDTYESIEEYKIEKIIDHIIATVLLMNAITQKKYNTIWELSAFLLYDEPIEYDINGIRYSTCKHEFTSLLNSSPAFRDISQDNEAIITKQIKKYDNYIDGENIIDIESFNSIRMGDGLSEKPGTKDKHFRSLYALYTNTNKSDFLSMLIDTLFNIQMEYGIISSFNKGISGIKSLKIERYEPYKDYVFNDRAKELLLAIGKYVISEEINHNIKDIKPSFDSQTLSPIWKIDSMIQALYFSIFYMKPGVEIYKECENPNCRYDRYFLVSSTKSNKKYCCDLCRNAAGAQRFRMKKKFQ